MNLEDLRAAQVDERGTDSLQPLPPTFYEEAADYLAELRTRRDRVADRADDPFGSEAVRQLTDELETAGEVVEALYERRVGKIVKRASLTAAGMPADETGLTEEERTLFADLVERIEGNRETVLSALDARDGGSAVELASGARSARGTPSSGGKEAPGDAEPRKPAEVAPETDPRGEAADSEAGQATEDRIPGDHQADETDRPDEPDRLTVRITADVGEIYGVDDRVYTLDAEDVVTLPSANAKPLLDRGAAERVD